MTDIPTVLVQTEGGRFVSVVFDGAVRVLIVDEDCPRDRVYRCSMQATAEEIDRIVGDSPIGHIDDGLLGENESQGIRAMASRLAGGTLRVVTDDKEQE